MKNIDQVLLRCVLHSWEVINQLGAICTKLDVEFGDDCDPEPLALDIVDSTMIEIAKCNAQLLSSYIKLASNADYVIDGKGCIRSIGIYIREIESYTVEVW